MTLKRAAKELFRDCMTKTPLNGLYLQLRKWRGESLDHLEHDSVPERFSAIYRDRVWLSGRASGSLSGPGSDTENTGSVREHLQGLLSRAGTRTLLDIGCGDFNWMRQIPLSCNYVGIDVVRNLIAENNAKYGGECRTFQFVNAVSEPLPIADTALCREVLFHLSFADIKSLLRNVKSSGCEWLIATSDSVVPYNADILTGDYRMLNLRHPPFNFPEPVQTFPDDSLVPGRVLGLWKADTVADAVST